MVTITLTQEATLTETKTQGVLSPIQTNEDGLRWYAVPQSKKWSGYSSQITTKLETALNSGVREENWLTVGKQRNETHIGILYSLQGCAEQLPHLDGYEGVGISWIIPLGGRGEIVVWHEVETQTQ